MTGSFNEEYIVSLVVLGVKGDWAFLVKSGMLTRNYLQLPKRVPAKTHCPGICHLCRAGQPDSPYEDTRD